MCVKVLCVVRGVVFLVCRVCVVTFSALSFREKINILYYCFLNVRTYVYCMLACVRACVSVCVCVCVNACARVCLCVCVFSVCMLCPYVCYVCVLGRVSNIVMLGMLLTKK